jgi:mannose-1-phosphate guanylyltransferase
MKAMILAAGQGTRLRPLTLVRPKVLAAITGSSVLDFWIRRLHHAGFEAVVINAYHLHERLVAAVRNGHWPIPVHVVVEPELLGTGGGIRNVLDFFEGQPFLAINGDIICDAPLQDLRHQYFESGSAAGLLMHEYPEFNNVAVDSRGRILGFGDEAKRLVAGNSDWRCLAFSGIHIIHPEILGDFPEGHPGDILTAYRAMIDAGHAPVALQWPGLFWREIGAIASYRNLHRELGSLEENIIPPLQTGRAIWLDPEAEVSPDVELRGYVSIGSGTRVMHGAVLEDSVLWDNVVIRRGSRLRNCIVADGVAVAGCHDNEIIIGSVG